MGDSRDNSVIGEIEFALKGYELKHIPRKSRAGGGVALLFNKSLSCAMYGTTAFMTFEYMDVSISSGTSSIRILIIYRPPKIVLQNGACFLDELYITGVGQERSLSSEILIYMLMITTAPFPGTSLICFSQQI